jgi:hypothetical protein
MLRNFWFYFNLIPFLFGAIILFTPILNLFPLNPPKITNAVEYCSDVINKDVYATEYGTYQDFCIAKFMGETRILKPLVIFFSFIGILFIIPLILFIIFFNYKLKRD